MLLRCGETSFHSRSKSSTVFPQRFCIQNAFAKVGSGGTVTARDSHLTGLCFFTALCVAVNKVPQKQLAAAVLRGEEQCGLGWKAL